jgi:hypothetical protein
MSIGRINALFHDTRSQDTVNYVTPNRAAF